MRASVERAHTRRAATRSRGKRKRFMHSVAGGLFSSSSSSSSSSEFFPFPPSLPFPRIELGEDFNALGVPPPSRHRRYHRGLKSHHVSSSSWNFYFLIFDVGVAVAVARTIVGSFVYECVVAFRNRAREGDPARETDDIHPDVSSSIHRSILVSHPFVRAREIGFGLVIICSHY